MRSPDCNAFDVPLQSAPMSAERVIDELDSIASPATVAIAGPRYFGFINSGALPAALAANWLSTAWEQHGGFQISSPGKHAARADRAPLDHRAARRFRPTAPARSSPEPRPPTSRHSPPRATRCSSRSGWNAGADGLFGAPPITVIAGAEAHPTLFKALGVVGLGRDARH